MAGVAGFRLGLRNADDKYLTAEKFAFKVNASAATFRAKQIWSLEVDGNDDRIVYLRSHLDRYLTVNRNGDVTCDAENREENQRFILEYDMGSSQGRWALKSKVWETYLGGSDENLQCMNREAEWWTPHMALHPQVVVRNLCRKRYARQEGDELQCTELVPWGQSCLVTLELSLGRLEGYAFRGFDGRYLKHSGEMTQEVDQNCLLTIQVHADSIREGLQGINLQHGRAKTYLTAIGPGTMKCQSRVAAKDQVFIFEESLIQVSVISSKGKRSSIKQGIDVLANQDGLSPSEIFQMEFEPRSKKFRLRTHEHSFWAINASNAIQAIENEQNMSEKSLFELEHVGNFVKFKASNGQYISAKGTGTLTANGQEAENFVLEIVNRPLLVLRGQHGFLGFRKDSTKVECAKSIHDVMKLQYLGDGKYAISSMNGKFWTVKDDGIVHADGSQPHPFHFHFQPKVNSFAVRTDDGRFLFSDQKGLTAKSGPVSDAAIFEY